MPERLETTQEVDRSSATDQGLLARESVSSLSDIKAIFGSPSKGSVSALEEQFGDLILVDDSKAASGKTPLLESQDTFSRSSGPAQDRIVEDVNDPPVRRIDSQHGVVELDENGQTRRAVEVDQDGLRSREVKVPEGFIPTEGAAAPRDNSPTPQDRIIEDVNDPPVRRIDSQNGVVELDENGQTRRAVEVDQDGLRSREVKVPEGFIPTEGAAAPRDKFQAPQDKLVDVDNQRKPVITLNRENSGFETDEDGEIRRAFVVDDDGRKSVEIEND
jgi:hypothetical protein